ncbi:MAG: MlaD family protein [Thermodesulfobacteriota bacterium]|jgi:phospholipid/cholesterol/gamma-HCH transport system substrate-binding protein
MEKKGVSTEVKVGIFVFLGLIVLGYMTLKVEKFKLKTERGYEIAAFFDSASGLVEGGAVQIAGIEVGRVKDIRLTGRQARVTLTIRKEIPVFSDAQASLKTQGVLGDTYVEINPGSDKTPRLLAGGVIRETSSPIELGQIVAKAMPVVDDIRSVTKTLSEVIGTEAGKTDLKGTFANFNKATDDIRSMTAGLSRGEGTMGKLIRDDTLYKDMRTTVTGLKDTVAQINEGKGTIGKLIKDQDFYDETKKTLTSLQKVAGKIESGEGSLGKLINDDSLYKEAKETIANLNQTTSKINQGEGTIGKLINDDSLHKEIRYTLRSVNKAAEGLSEQVPVSILGTIIGTIIK